MRFELPVPSRRRLISLTPLIDVVFILLFFFMLASKLTQLYSVPLDAPASAATEQAPERALLLRIHADGGLDLNGQTIRAADLAPTVGRWLEQTPGLRVLIQPDDQVPLQTTLEAFDALADAGVPILRLQ